MNKSTNAEWTLVLAGGGCWRGLVEFFEVSRVFAYEDFRFLCSDDQSACG